VFTTDDTIVAIATPPGRGGLGVVRLSGPDSTRIALELCGRAPMLEPRRATFARIRAACGTADQVILTYFQAPQSYTGDDVVEVSAHGSPILLQAIVTGAMTAGARLAEPGEFTFRAFLKGRIDLVQAEAVADLIDAVTPLQARAAFDQLEGTLTGHIRAVDADLFDLAARLEASLDFPDEGYHFVEADTACRELIAIIDRLTTLLESAARGRLLREGCQVAIVGRPNAGKSSLFNRLAGAGRAIVTDVPGTTRDLLTETIDVDGIPMTIVDTAGVREASSDPIEAEGITRAIAARDVASVIVVVLDRSMELTDDDKRLIDATASKPRVLAATKIDLPRADWNGYSDSLPLVFISARTGQGIDQLRTALASTLLTREPDRDPAALTNIRHVNLLERAKVSLVQAREAATAGTPEEFVLADVTEARACLEEITGRRTPDDVLRAIFDRFCIGK
jgi:tRNA modification GTPase